MRLAGLLVATLALAAACARARPAATAAPDGGRPDAAPPVVAVEVSLPGRGAAEVEAAVVAPLEEALVGYRWLRSVARPGLARVTVAPAEAGAVRDAVARVLRRLPSEAAAPLLSVEPRAEPVLRYALASDTLPLRALSELQERAIAPRLSTIPGVARVAVCGLARAETVVHVDPARLAALAVPVADVVAAARAGGRPEELLQSVVAARNGAPVRLGDVARVEDATARPDCVAYREGARVAIGEVSVPAAADAAAVRAELATRLRAAAAELPAGVTLIPLVEDGPWRPWQPLPAGTRADEAAARAAQLSVGGVARWHDGRIERLDGPPALEVLVTGPELDAVGTLAAAVARAATAGPEVVATGTEGAELEPRLEVVWDADRLAALGVRRADAELALRAARDGVPAGPGVRVRVEVGADLSALTVDGKVPLAQVARLEERAAPAAIRHENRTRCAVVWLRLPALLDETAVAALRRRVAAVPVPAGLQVIGPRPFSASP